MYFSFCSKKSFVLGGEIVMPNEIKTIELKRDSFIQAHFINGKTENLVLNQDFLFSPPPHITVTDLKGGFLIDFNPPPDNGFAILKTNKTAYLSATLYFDNGVKLLVENEDGKFIKEIDTCGFYGFLGYDLQVYERGNSTLIAVILSGTPNVIAVYGFNDELKECGVFVADEYDLGDTLTITQKKKDVLYHTVKSSFELKDGLPPVSKTVTREKEFSEIHQRIIPYAFLEEFSLGRIELSVLSGGIRENADKLNGYLGEFIGVFPPPFFREYDEIGLIKKRADNLYYADYVKAEIDFNKITNIKISQ